MKWNTLKLQVVSLSLLGAISIFCPSSLSLGLFYSTCLIHTHIYVCVCVCEYPYIGYIQWEVKQMKALDDWEPLFLFEMVEWSEEANRIRKMFISPIIIVIQH